MIKKIGRVLFYDYNKNHFGRIQDDISGVSLNFKLGKRENDLFLKDDQLIFYDLQLAKNGISYYAKDISIINSIDFTIGDYRSIIRLFSQNNIDIYIMENNIPSLLMLPNMPIIDFLFYKI